MQRKTFSNAPYEATVKLMAKPDTDITHTHTHTHTQLEVNITDEHRYKNPPQIIANGIHEQNKNIIHHDQVEFIPGCKDSWIYASQLI